MTREQIRSSWESVIFTGTTDQIDADELREQLELLLDNSYNVDDDSVDSTFDGTVAIKAVPSVGDIPGGSTVTEFLTNLFYPFIPASLSMSSFSTQEVGSDINPTISGTLTLNDEDTVTERRVIDVTGGNSTLDNPTSNNISFTISSPVTVTSGSFQSYRIEADVDNNGSPTTLSASRSITGVYPFLYGMESSDLNNSNFYTTLTKDVSAKGDKNVTLNGSSSYIYFMYPSSYGSLSGIIDPNGFDVTGSFTESTVTVDSSGLDNNWSGISYTLYKSVLTNINSAAYEFNF